MGWAETENLQEEMQASGFQRLSQTQQRGKTTVEFFSF